MAKAIQELHVDHSPSGPHTPTTPLRDNSKCLWFLTRIRKKTHFHIFKWSLLQHPEKNHNAPSEGRFLEQSHGVCMCSLGATWCLRTPSSSYSGMNFNPKCYVNKKKYFIPLLRWKCGISIVESLVFSLLCPSFPFIFMQISVLSTSYLQNKSLLII